MKYKEIEYVFSQCDKYQVNAEMIFKYRNCTYKFIRDMDGLKILQEEDEDFEEIAYSVKEMFEDNFLDDYEISFKDAFESVKDIKITPEFHKLYHYIRKYKKKKQDEMGSLIYKLKKESFSDENNYEIRIYDNLSSKNNLFIEREKNSKKIVSKKTLKKEEIEKIKNILLEYVDRLKLEVKAKPPIQTMYTIDINIDDINNQNNNDFEEQILKEKEIRKHIMVYNLEEAKKYDINKMTEEDYIKLSEEEKDKLDIYMLKKEIDNIIK